MYKLPHFTETDQQALIDFMSANSFAIIVTSSEAYPVATHVPLQIQVNEKGKIVLSGHIMRKSDHHKAFEKNERVLVIFNGPHTYISASWYSNAQSASTWNYMTVHAKGKISLLDDNATYEAVKNLTDQYEGHSQPASFGKLGDAYVHPLIKAIVAFNIEVETIENVFKLSQNRDEVSKKNIIARLKERGDENSVKIAEEMEKRQ